MDSELGYEPFFADFGPLSLGSLFRFSQILADKLNVSRYEPVFECHDTSRMSSHCAHGLPVRPPVSQNPDLAAKKIVFYTSHDAHKRANGAVLIGGYSVTPCEGMWACMHHSYRSWVDCCTVRTPHACATLRSLAFPTLPLHPDDSNSLSAAHYISTLSNRCDTMTSSN